MEDGQQWGPPQTSPRAGFIFDIFIHPQGNGMNKEIFKFRKDAEFFWMAKGCADGKEFRRTSQN